MTSLNKFFFYKNKLSFVTASFLIILGNLLTVCYAWGLQLLLDAISAGDTDGLFRVMIYIAIILTAVFITQMFLKRVRCYFVKKAMQQYKNEAFRRITNKNITSFAKENTNTYLSVLTNDASSIEYNFLYGTFKILGKMASFLGAFALMLWYNWLMTLIVFVLCIIPVALAVVSSGKMTELEMEISSSNEKFMGMLKNLLEGFSVIKSFRAERRSETIFHEENEKLEKTKFCKKNREGTIAAVSSEISSLIQMGVFAIGGIFVVKGIFTIGIVLAFVQLMNNIMEPVQAFPGLLVNWKAARGLICKMEMCVAENRTQSGGERLEILQKKITMDDVSFGYEDCRNVLKNISVTFGKGKSYAIVGESGSGKSTLLSLLLHGYDSYQGSILYDGTELGSLDSESLFQLVSVVQQNVFIFQNSILENITMFQTIGQDEVEKAVQMSGLDTLVKQRGYDYNCGENGVNLSGGERQRISIARSLLKKSSVLLMDEATAALDAEIAKSILIQILELEDILRIVVTHSLDREILVRFDEILVMRDGKIVEKGTFSELMENKNYFYSLYNVSHR